MKPHTTMPRLVTVTFTGVDDTTDLRRLSLIQEHHPLAEFGVLLSAHGPENGPRYPSMDTIRSLRHHPLNLSLHLCGRLARKAVHGDFSEVETLLGEDVSLFRRVQLNVVGYDGTPERIGFPNPSWAREVIIQQRSASDCRLFLDSPRREGLTVLLDASGGRGVQGTTTVLPGCPKVGYAGGINHRNVYGILSALLASPEVNDFWIDMESGVRTRDRFDPGLVEAVLSEIKNAYGMDL